MHTRVLNMLLWNKYVVLSPLYRNTGARTCCCAFHRHVCPSQRELIFRVGYDNWFGEILCN